jgi:hypothetical protein
MVGRVETAEKLPVIARYLPQRGPELERSASSTSFAGLVAFVSVEATVKPDRKHKAAEAQQVPRGQL